MGSFNPRAVLGMVLFGAVMFIALLWFVGKGDTNSGPDNGQSHAASRGLTGYAGLVALLEKQGHAVSLSRSRGQLETDALLVLTPTAFADAGDIAAIIEARRFTGPTLLILPKWYASNLPASVEGARKGWVQLGGGGTAGWTSELKETLAMKVRVARLGTGAVDWRGLGLSGKLPNPARAAGLEEGPWASLVRDSTGRDLVAYADDHGCYPVLDRASGLPASDDCDGDKWNLTVVFEPDLFNNYGLADRDRAILAARVVELAREEQDIPIVFDLTLNGLGGTRNLATLAFEPPFLAATLCLLLALAVVAWRAFARFGPPIAEERAVAFGKARLAANAGGFIRRSGRLHLLSGPYADLIARRLAAALGLRQADPEAIDAALVRRGLDGPGYRARASDLSEARGPSATLRAAHALKSLERTVTR